MGQRECEVWVGGRQWEGREWHVKRRDPTIFSARIDYRLPDGHTAGEWPSFLTPTSVLPDFHVAS